MMAAQDVDWNSLGFNLFPGTKVVFYTWTKPSSGECSGWDGGVVSDGMPPIDPWATAIHYGQSAFEGLKAFRMKDGKIRIFRPHLNAERLAASCAALALPQPPTDLFLAAVARAVEANKDVVPPFGTNASLYIRPVVFGSGPQIGLTPATTASLLVLVNPVGDYYHTASSAPVRALIQANLDRAAPNGTGNIKAGGNYAPIFRPSAAAKAKGYSVLLFLDPKHSMFVEEFATSNFIAVTPPDAAGRRTVVTPKSTSILPSITNRSITEIAYKKFGWVVERRRIPWTQIKDHAFDEVAACGTAVVMTPIQSIDREVVASKPIDTSDLDIVSTETTPIDKLWSDAVPTTDPPSVTNVSIETVDIPNKFTGALKKLESVYRGIQKGELDEWKEWKWMYPEQGI